MGQGSDNTAKGEAIKMLETFGSVGVNSFALTMTNREGEKTHFRRSLSLDAIRRTIGSQLSDAEERQQNLILRPHSSPVLLQLDDIDQAGIERLRPVAFLALETSPNNYQAWLALPTEDDDLARRIRKAAGADPSASGATRIAGSRNYKDKYAPDFPTVHVAYSAPGRTTTKEQLETLHLIASPEPLRLAPVRVSNARRRAAWPSYQRCIEGAPPTHGNTGPDVSRADFTWCLIALDWGWSVEATADRLMAESRKARQNGPRYALRTAERAAAVRRGVERPPASLSIQAPREGEFRPFLGASAKRGSPDAG